MIWHEFGQELISGFIAAIAVKLLQDNVAERLDTYIVEPVLTRVRGWLRD